MQSFRDYIVLRHDPLLPKRLTIEIKDNDTNYSTR